MNDDCFVHTTKGEYEMKRILAKDMKSASYCCEASETVSVEELNKCENLKRELAKDMKSASYCCEASETVSVNELPSE